MRYKKVSNFNKHDSQEAFVIEKQKQKFTNEEIVEQDTKALPSPISQLLYVLPYDDYNLIPTKDFNKFNHLVNKEINLIETNFPIHFDFCKFFWEGYVDFNYIDLKRLDKTVNKWNL
jgi:hypothetical protein